MEKLTEKQKSVLTKYGMLYLHCSREDVYNRSELDYFVFVQIDRFLLDLCEMLDVYYEVCRSLTDKAFIIYFYDVNDVLIFTFREDK